MIIYRIRNLINNKVYIGQTIQSFRARERQHFNYPNRCPLLNRAIKKYGKENFEMKEISQGRNPDELNLLEEFYIQHYNSLAPNGYNLTLGGMNTSPSQETRDKISNALKGRKPSEETRKKLSEAWKGRVMSPETCEKIRKGLMGNKNNAGKVLSEETRKKIGDAHRGKTVILEVIEKVSQALKKFYRENPERKILGEANHASKLTEFQVREIKMSFQEGKSSKDIKDKYPVNLRTLQDIEENKTWKHVII